MEEKTGSGSIPVEISIGPAKFMAEAVGPAVATGSLNAGRVANKDVGDLGVDWQDWEQKWEEDFVIRMTPEGPEAGWAIWTDKAGVVSLGVTGGERVGVAMIANSRPSGGAQSEISVDLVEVGRAGQIQYKKIGDRLRGEEPEHFGIDDNGQVQKVVRVDGKYFLITIGARRRKEQETITGALRTIYDAGSWEVKPRVQEITEPQVIP